MTVGKGGEARPKNTGGGGIIFGGTGGQEIRNREVISLSAGRVKKRKNAIALEGGAFKNKRNLGLRDMW